MAEKISLSKILFFTGKGGVGKSLFSASQALQFASQGKRVLWVDFENSGVSTELFQRDLLKNTPEKFNGLSLISLGGRESFYEYLETVLGVDDESQKSFLSSIKLKSVDTLKKIKSLQSFIDLCPGLKSIMLIGKIIKEQQRQKNAWDYICVDAPATGHFLDHLKSFLNSQKLFTSESLSKKITAYRKVLENPESCEFQLVTLPYDFVLHETQLLSRELTSLGFSQQHLILNKSPMNRIVQKDQTLPACFQVENLINQQQQESCSEFKAFFESFLSLKKMVDFGPMNLFSLTKLMENEL